MPTFPNFGMGINTSGLNCTMKIATDPKFGMGMNNSGLNCVYKLIGYHFVFTSGKIVAAVALFQLKWLLS